MFKKMLAKFGKGAAKVDLVLNQESFALGEELAGQIFVRGGTVKQEINKITIDLKMDVRSDDHTYTKLIHRFEITDSFEIQPEEEKMFPMQFQLPYNLLLSARSVTYYFVTQLDIKSGKDHADHDVVIIHPHTHLQNLLFAFEQLGFVETADSRTFDGYLQEFEYAPTSLFHDQLEEIEFNVIIKEDGIMLLLELDCYSLLGEKEISRECWIENALLDDVEALAHFLREFIEETIQQSSFYVGEKKHLQKNYYQLAGAVGAVAVGLIVGKVFEEVADEIGDQLEDMLDEEEEEEDSFFGDDDEEEDSFFGDEDD